MVTMRKQPSTLSTSPQSVSYTTTHHKFTCDFHLIRSMKHLTLILAALIFAALLSPATSALPDDSSLNSTVITTTIVLPSHFISPSNNDSSSLVNGTVSSPPPLFAKSDSDSGVTSSSDDEETLEEDTTITTTTTQVIPPHLKGKCLMKDTCDTKANILGDVYVPCMEYHDPHPIDQESVETLKRLCPSFFRDTKNPFVCCSPEQLEELDYNMKIALQLGLSRCPSCSYNWRLNLCEMTCSPKQSDFVKATNTSKLEDGRTKIEEIEIHIHEDYPTMLYDSCKNVQGLASGKLMIELMCGPWGRECTGTRWLEFIGKSIDNGGQSPFQMNYVFHNDDEDESALLAKDGSIISPLKPVTYSCSQKPSPRDLPCSCSDCLETCERKILPPSVRILPEDSPPVEIFGLTGAIASSILLFLFSTSLILTYFSLKSYNRRRTRNRKFICTLLTFNFNL